MTETGDYVTIGRATDPSEEDIRHVEGGLRAQGAAGWLAVMDGNPYEGGMPRLMEVRPLAEPGATFAQAEAAFLNVIRRGRA